MLEFIYTVITPALKTAAVNAIALDAGIVANCSVKSILLESVQSVMFTHCLDG